MRYAPLLPARRPAFGRRTEAIDPAALGEPTREERRLIDRIISHVGRRPPR